MSTFLSTHPKQASHAYPYPTVASLRLLLYVNHPLFSQSLRHTLETEVGFQMIGEAANGRELLRYAFETQPDVIVMALLPTGSETLSALRTLLDERPESKVVLIASDHIGQYGFETLKVLEQLKQQHCFFAILAGGVEELTRGIQQLASGHTPKHSARLMPACPDDEPYDQVSERERDALCLVALGLSNKEIAQELGISEKTVRNRLSEVYSKLGLENRTQAALYALRRGMVPLHYIDTLERDAGANP